MISVYSEIGGMSKRKIYSKKVLGTAKNFRF